jgi:hypothetical protein
MSGELPLSLRVSAGDGSVTEATEEPFELRFFRFGVRARIYEADRYIETIFPDGSAVPACPQPTSEYRATAGRLGYGDDL